jgi:serine/threonine-protein kinase
MARLWPAKNLDRIVALKMLLFGPHAPPESVKRFRAEAVATAALQHPHIVAIHEVGFCEGQHFIAMDYVEGSVCRR